MEVSGNAKWLAVCAGTGATDLPLAEKYSSGVAKAYKSSVLRAAADPVADNTFTATAFLSMLAGISSPFNRDDVTPDPADAKQVAPPPTANQPSSRSADGTSVKCTTCRSMVAIDQLDAHSSSCSVNASRTVEWRKYERKLGVPGASLGFSLTKTNAGFAEVSRIIPDGEAERANVLVGSYLVGLNDVKHAKFDDIVNMLKTLPRPMLFHFVFRPHMAAVKPTNAVSSVPEPRTVEIEVTLQEKEELGCSLSATEFYCVVRSVDQADCIARRHGILVGSRVVAVNGRKYLKPKDLIREICTAQRPIQLKLHRVEGLMRGWNS
ncbi:hypothetical protein BBJ28_00011654 [Nothophytophthora sp. Chile5]|nr:hypothetical protein BBJ28_00011654 [Nothophytophthora sp. Chile5]